MPETVRYWLGLQTSRKLFLRSRLEAKGSFMSASCFQLWLQPPTPLKEKKKCSQVAVRRVESKRVLEPQSDSTTVPQTLRVSRAFFLLLHHAHAWLDNRFRYVDGGWERFRDLYRYDSNSGDSWTTVPPWWVGSYWTSLFEESRQTMNKWN